MFESGIFDVYYTKHQTYYIATEKMETWEAFLNPTRTMVPSDFLIIDKGGYIRRWFNLIKYSAIALRVKDIERIERKRVRYKKLQKG